MSFVNQPVIICTRPSFLPLTCRGERDMVPSFVPVTSDTPYVLTYACTGTCHKKILCVLNDSRLELLENISISEASHREIRSCISFLMGTRRRERFFSRLEDIAEINRTSMEFSLPLNRIPL